MREGWSTLKKLIWHHAIKGGSALPDGSHQINEANRGRDTNAEASTQWVERAKERYGEDWENVAQCEFVKGADNK